MAVPLVRRCILCPVRDQIRSLKLGSLSSNTPDSFWAEGLVKPSMAKLPSNGDGDGDDKRDQVKSLASFVTKKIDDIIKFGEPPFPLLYGAEVYANWRYGGDMYPDDIRLICMNRIVDLIKRYPEVDKIQIFHAKIYYASLLRGDDSSTELTKDEIIARVLKITQSYPKVGDYKVTEDTHFCKDLGFNKWDVIDIIQALQVDFKLDMPDYIDSCKLANEYIYDHRTEKLRLEEFQKRFLYTTEFGESKSEVRRIYLRAEEMGSKNAVSDSGQDKQSRGVNWNGINLSQFFLNMQSNYYPS